VLGRGADRRRDTATGAGPTRGDRRRGDWKHDDATDATTM